MSFSKPQPMKVTKTVTEANSFTDALPLDANERASVSVNGATWAATAVLQRRLPGAAEDDWFDVPNADGTVGFTANTEKTYEADERCDLRLGSKTGGFTSGSYNARLGKG